MQIKDINKIEPFIFDCNGNLIKSELITLEEITKVLK